MRSDLDRDRATTQATIPETGPVRYFRYLVRRCVEEPRLFARGVKALTTPRVAYLDLLGAPWRSVIIFSSQRSGSTLLGEVLVRHDRQRFMFEPFWRVAVGPSRNIARGRYVSPGTDEPELDRVLKRVLSGRVRNLHVDRFNTCRLVRGRVIKDVYGTNLSPYLAAHFPEVPLIFLLRHPVAAAHSAVSLGWEDNLEAILGQRDLLTEHFPAQAPLIDSVVASERHTVVAFVLRWCLENYLPVQMLRRSETHVIFYEDLVRSGGVELDRLASFLRRRSPVLWSGWTPDPALLWRPAATSRPDNDPGRSLEEHRVEWQGKVPAAQLERSLDVLEGFGLHRLFGAGPDPLVGADQVLVTP